MYTTIPATAAVTKNTWAPGGMEVRVTSPSRTNTTTIPMKP
jgi:hypothetical protein